MRKGVVITPADLIGCDWIGLMQELKLNTLGLHSGGGASHRVIPALKETGLPEFRHRYAMAGIDIEYEVHAADDLIDRELFAVHPEFFSQPFRLRERLREGNWCAGHGALDEVGANAARLALALPSSTHRFFLWSSDSVGSWCHCDACANLTCAEQSLLATNRMAEAIREVDPAGSVAFLAYLQTLECPRAVRPAANVFLEFAPIERCFHHAIDDANCAVNRRIWRNFQELLELFAPEQAHVLEYWLDSSLFSGWQKPAKAPDISPDIVWRDLQAYHRLGINSITSFAVYMDGEYFERHGDAALRQYAEMINQL